MNISFKKNYTNMNMYNYDLNTNMLLYTYLDVLIYDYN